MFEKEISELVFTDQIIGPRMCADRVARNGRDGDHVVDPSKTGIGDVIENVPSDQTSEMSRDVEGIVLVMFLSEKLLFECQFRGELLEQIFQIPSTVEIERLEQFDELGEIHQILVDHPRRRRRIADRRRRVRRRKRRRMGQPFVRQGVRRRSMCQRIIRQTESSSNSAVRLNQRMTGFHSETRFDLLLSCRPFRCGSRIGFCGRRHFVILETRESRGKSR